MESTSPQRTGIGWKIFLFLAVVLLTGAMLAPLFFKLGRWYADVAESFRQQNTPILGPLAQLCRDSPFARFFNRAMLVSMIGWLWPFARWMGVGRGAAGLQANKFRVQDTLVGFIIASSLLLAMGAGYVASGHYISKESARQQELAKPVKPGAEKKKPPPQPVDIGSLLLAAGVAAVAVALLEEWLFRGVLLGLLLRSLKPWLAVISLSAFFSILHLLQPPESFLLSESSVNWLSGFVTVGVILSKFGDPTIMVMEFSTLFLVGILLAWARVRTGSLWLSIGLHAGWVFALKFFSGITQWNKSAHAPNSAQPWLGNDLRVGLIPLFVLGFTGLVMWGWMKARAKALDYATKFKSR